MTPTRIVCSVICAAAGFVRWRRGICVAMTRRLTTIGLNPRVPLTVASTSQLRARQLRERIDTDERVRAGMEQGVALARSGLLQARAREIAARRGVRVQREQALVEDGRQLGASGLVRFVSVASFAPAAWASMASRTICVSDTWPVAVGDAATAQPVGADVRLRREVTLHGLAGAHLKRAEQDCGAFFEGGRGWRSSAPRCSSPCPGATRGR
jgi:hypothetical protein